MLHTMRCLLRVVQVSLTPSQDNGWLYNSLLGDATLPLLVAAATFQIQQREFEGFENGN